MKILLADMKIGSHQMFMSSSSIPVHSHICHLHREAEIKDPPWMAALLLSFDLFLWFFFQFQAVVQMGLAC